MSAGENRDMCVKLCQAIGRVRDAIRRNWLMGRDGCCKIILKPSMCKFGGGVKVAEKVEPTISLSDTRKKSGLEEEGLLSRGPLLEPSVFPAKFSIRAGLSVRPTEVVALGGRLAVGANLCPPRSVLHCTSIAFYSLVKGGGGQRGNVEERGMRS